jgi:hypothetical protein
MLKILFISVLVLLRLVYRQFPAVVRNRIPIRIQIHRIQIHRIQIHRIQIHRIHMFLGLPDPNPLVTGVDPDPNPPIIKQK